MKRPWKKRLLAMFLSVSMLLTLVPGAFALEDEGGQSKGLTWKQVDNDAVSAPIGLEAETIEAPPETKPLHEDDEEVRVSIVLEEEPTLALFSMDGENGLPADGEVYREALHEYQDAVAEYISEEVLDEPLDVVRNLTLVANIISANVKYGEIEDIKALEGIDDVIVETRFEIQGFPVKADPNMVISTGMTNTTQTWDTGYTGAGTRIAIIDTGLDIEHQSFDNDAFLHALEEDARNDKKDVSDYGLLDTAELAGKLSKLNIADTGVTAEELYYTDKIPFRFNYVDGDTDVLHINDYQGEHGSHVAGIAAANRYIKQQDGTFTPALTTDGVFMNGNAPDAQVLVMKVFGKGGGAYEADYMAAIEDAIALNCDTVNLSLGSGEAGMSFNTKYQDILDGLVKANTIVTMSAGNSSYWAKNTNYGLPYSDDVNFHTGGSPGSYTNPLTVASVDNDGLVADGVIAAFGKNIAYTEGESYGNERIATLDPDGTGTEYDFVYLDTIGEAEDFEAVDVSGKIAFCNRGGNYFNEKANNAASHGAVAVVICNNQPGSIGLALEDYMYTAPVVSISLSSANYLKEHAAKSTFATDGSKFYYTGTLTLKASTTVAEDKQDYKTMSGFSSWGMPGDLSLKPEITAPGGSIWSLFGETPLGGGHDVYESMSGTSMASPQMAGIGALVKQAIKTRGISQNSITDRALAQSLMMSTAVPLKDAKGNYYPVIQQGAGMVDTLAAVNADSYILMDSSATVSYKDGKVKSELKDDPAKSGSYEVTFTINNLDGKAHSYSLDAAVFTQNVVEDDIVDDMWGEVIGKVNLLDTATRPLFAGVQWSWNGKVVTGNENRIYDFNGDGLANYADGNALLDVATGLSKQNELSNQYLLNDFTTGKQVNSYTGYEFLQKLDAATGLTVPANGSVTVTATITLDPDAVAEMMDLCPNGFYVEAYLYATADSTSEGVQGTAHSIPVLGFYGNWTDPSMFEKGSFLDYYSGKEITPPYMEGQTYTPRDTNVVTYQKAGGSSEFVLGLNPFLEDDEYLPERSAFSAVSGDKISLWSFTPIRNVAASRLLIRNADPSKEVYADNTLGAALGAYYHTNSGMWVNTSIGINVNWTGTDAKGNALPDGTQVEMTLTLAPEMYVDGETVRWDKLGKGATQTMTFTIDNTKPVLTAVAYDKDRNVLSVTLRDNRFAAYVALLNEEGTRVLKAVSPNQALEDQGKEITVDLDLDGVLASKDAKFLIRLGDYADNQSTYELTGDFDPNMDLSPDVNAYYYGFDAFPERKQWIALSEDGSDWAIVGYGGDAKAQEEYLTAGAYAKGYVFAFDNIGNFYAYPANKDLPLIGDSQFIAFAEDALYPHHNGEVYDSGWMGDVGEVCDMAYDAKNDTMYLTYYGIDVTEMFWGLNTERSPMKLGTVNLQTGEITELGILSRVQPDTEEYDNSMWFALACDDDGNLYGLEYGTDYTIDPESWEGTPVHTLYKLSIDPSSVDIKKSEPVEVDVVGNTYYMTWDSYEDKLLVSAEGEGENWELFDGIYAVDPSTGEAEIVADTGLIDYSCLLTALFVDPGDNAEVMPGAANATSISLSKTSLSMIPGADAALTAALTPWNLADRTVTWTSSDENVATVSEKGVVHAVSAGKTTITARAVSGGVTAACEVQVVGLDTTLNAMVWGDGSIVHWASFPVSDPKGWQDLGEFKERFTSAARVGSQVYAALQDGDSDGTLYAVDPSAHTGTKLGNMGGFPVDMTEMPNGHMLGVNTIYILDIDPANPEYTMPRWTAEGMLERTTYFVACAYLGESTIHDTIGIYNAEKGEYEDFEEDWPVSVYALIDMYGDVYYFACEDETGHHVAWIARYCSTGYEAMEPMLNSAVYAYNKDGVPTLFWSYYTGNSSRLFAISLDGNYDGENLSGTFMGDLGEFGGVAWPVIGLMSEAAPAVPSSVSDMLNSGKMQQLGAAKAVTPNGLLNDEAEDASEPADGEDEEAFVENAAGVSEDTEVSEEPEVPAVPEEPEVPEVPEVPEDDMETLSMSINSSAAAPSVDTQTGEVTLELKLDEASTNGLIQVEYDSQALKLVRVDGRAVLNSANDSKDGEVVYAYAYKSAKSAGTTVATLHFASRTMEDTTVIVTTQERNTDMGLNDVETVHIGLEATGPGVNPDPLPTWPSIPARPSKPTQPAKPVEPTEPAEPENPGTAAQPVIPVINVPAAPAPARVEEIIAPYTDLQSGQWYSGYAAYVIDNGLMSGTSTTDFAPDSPLTRGMLVTILHRAAGQPAAGTAPFRDVPAGAWFANGVAWAAGNGLVNGRGEGIFDPNGNITRQELAVILWRFAKAMGLDVSAKGMTMPDFADRGEIASWAGEAMAWAYRSGIITGRDSTHLAPNDGASRIETAAMLVRFLRLVENSQSPNV